MSTDFLPKILCETCKKCTGFEKDSGLVYARCRWNNDHRIYDKTMIAACDRYEEQDVYIQTCPDILCASCKRCRGFDVTEPERPFPGEILTRCELREGEVLKGMLLKVNCPYYEKEAVC